MNEVKFNRTDFISVYEDVYTPEECKSLIDFIDLLEDRSLLVDEGEKEKHLIEHYSANLALHYDLPAWSWIAQNISPSLRTCTQHYLDVFSVLNRERYFFLDFKVKRIPPGGGFHNWHYEDSGLAQANRYLVIQVYLNDDYEAGETEFLYFNKRIKPKAGSVAIYPAAFTHTHRGNPPIDGTKYIINTWGLVQSRDEYGNS